MSEIDPEPQGNRPKGHDEWTVADMANHNARFFDDRPGADDAFETAKNAPDVEPELFPPGKSPEWMYHGEDEYPTEPCGICGEPVSIADAKSGAGGQPIHPDCYADDDADTSIADGDATDAEIIGPDHSGAEPSTVEDQGYAEEYNDLPDRNVGDDPINWMPGDFVDEIDGVPAVNRKGFEVLSHFYDIDVYADLEVPPEDTDFEYCRVKATAVTADGRECEAYGSSHKKRGDDEELLLEMADTRARKRALSIATGVGAVAVEELKEGTAK